MLLRPRTIPPAPSLRPGSPGRRLLLLFLSLIVSWASRAPGVIGVSMSMADLYEQSEEVLVTEVRKGDPGVMELKVTRQPKGSGSLEKISLSFANGVTMPAVQPGEPAILFVGLKGAAIHVADGWLTARNSQKGMVVTKNQGPTNDFPGRTRALLRVVADLEAGKRTLANEVSHFVFRGDIRFLSEIPPHPTALVTADVNGDGQEDVLAVSEETAELLINAKGTLRSEGFGKAAGKWACSGDVNGDGRPDFLIGDLLWLNTPDGFKSTTRLSPLPKGRVIASALLDVTGDGKPDALLASANGEVTVYENPGTKELPWKSRTLRLWTGGEEIAAAAFSKDWDDDGKPHLLVVRESGPSRYALDSDGGTPADLRRLMGKAPSWGDGPWQVYGGTIIDIDANGLDDFYAAGPEFGAILNNRGFGTFLGNFTAKRVYGPSGLVWGQLTPKTVLGSADVHTKGMDDLLVATEDGRLFEVGNKDVEVYY